MPFGRRCHAIDAGGGTVAKSLIGQGAAARASVPWHALSGVRLEGSLIVDEPREC